MADDIETLEQLAYLLGTEERKEALAALERVAEELEAHHIVLKELRASIQPLQAERDLIRAKLDQTLAALTPSADTKAAYSGEFKISLTAVDEYGEEVTEWRLIPWTTIKEIMKAIRERAELSITKGANDEQA